MQSRKVGVHRRVPRIRTCNHARLGASLAGKHRVIRNDRHLHAAFVADVCTQSRVELGRFFQNFLLDLGRNFFLVFRLLFAVGMNERPRHFDPCLVFFTFFFQSVFFVNLGLFQLTKHSLQNVSV